MSSIEFRNHFLYFGANSRVEAENSLKFCKLIFEDDHHLVRSETILLFPELLLRLTKCDENGQAKVKQVLQCFLSCIESSWNQDGLK